jgi:alkylated DNA repair dioxygenase AlkB
MIDGLKYIPKFITEDEESSLVEIIDQQPWLTDLKRRTQHYGYKYDYTKKTIDPSLYLGPLPGWLDSYVDRLIEQKVFTEKPDQVIVNEYKVGQGIGKHVDCVSCFKDTIASLGLGSVCVMDFERVSDAKTGSMLFGPRDLLVLSGKARYDWMHSIPARTSDQWGEEILGRLRRISLTFRSVVKGE